MFKLRDYIKNAFVAQGESKIGSDSAITINLKVEMDEEQIHNDCKKLIEMLKNLRQLFESDYSFIVMEDKILLTVESDI